MLIMEKKSLLIWYNKKVARVQRCSRNATRVDSEINHKIRFIKIKKLTL